MSTGGRKLRMLGVARVSIDSSNPEEGEFAILVRDSHQRKGLGGQLMTCLIEAARDRHVREITGDVLAANSAMLRFSESLGFTVGSGIEPEIRKITLRL